MQIGIQLVGSVSTIAFVVVGMGIIFKLIDLIVGLRISRLEELQGLDIGEHGMEAYGGFQIFSTM
jgi:Amt family ammonium transporter